MFIDKIEHAHGSSIVREPADEIVGPDVVGSLRPSPYARALVEPQAPSWLLLLGNLESLAAPDSLRSILTNVSAGFTQLDRDASITVPAVPVGHRDDGPGQCGGPEL